MSQTYTQIAAQLQALGAVFAAPAVTAIPSKMQTPQVSEWNFQIQRQLTNSLVVNVNYVGNHSVKIPYTNAWYNAYDPYGIFPGVTSVPTAPKVPNYGQVEEVLNGGRSTYNGLNVTVRKQFTHGFTTHVNYTWGHGLDNVSNGGLFTYGDSLLGQMNPAGLKYNYGNSDYDIRHQLSADAVYSPNLHFSNWLAQGVLAGWQLSGKMIWRAGLPFSVIDGNWNGAITNNAQTTIPAQQIAGQSGQTSCSEASVNTPCLNASAFVNSADPNWAGYTSWPTQSRNQFRGPHFFDFDFSLYKNFKIKERVNLAVGMQAFNVFNHPNFQAPDNSLGDSTFGQIIGPTTTATPTSPYGTFLGYDSGPRSIQLTGKITF